MRKLEIGGIGGNAGYLELPLCCEGIDPQGLLTQISGVKLLHFRILCYGKKI